MRIGIFGGSFDPVHHGHLIVARALREHLGLEQVRLVPAGRQPLKGSGHGASAEDRAAMVELALAGEPGLEVDRLEVEREGPSYTVDTLRAIHERAPGAELTVLIGADAASEFPRWKDPEGIRALAQVVVFGRAGASGPVTGPEVVTVPQVEISATAIRARVKAGLSIRYLVPESVAAYIATRRLYQ